MAEALPDRYGTSIDVRCTVDRCGCRRTVTIDVVEAGGRKALDFGAARICAICSHGWNDHGDEAGGGTIVKPSV